MKKETVGTLAALCGLALVGFLGGAMDWRVGFGCLMFGCGVAFHACLSKVIRAVAVGCVLAVSEAKALLFFIFAAVAIGAGAGLIIWGGIKLWSSWNTIAPRLQRPEISMISVTDTPEVVLAAAQPGEPEVMTVAPKLVPVVLSSLYGISAMVPEGWTILYSTNLIDWEEPPPNVIVEERPEGYWKAVPRE